MNKKKYPHLLLMTVPFLLAFIVGIVFRTKPLQIIPLIRDDLEIGGFSDGDHGGNTKIFSFKHINKTLYMEYELKKGFQYPYAGIFIHFYKTKKGFIDVSSYDGIILKGDTDVVDKVNINLYSRMEEPEELVGVERMFSQSLRLKDDEAKKIILKKMKTPFWWLSGHGLKSDEDLVDNWKILTSIQIGSDHFILDKRDTIVVSGLYFYKSNSFFYICIALALFICYVIIFIFKKSIRKHEPISVPDLPYQPLEIESYADNEYRKIANHLKEHYDNPELSLSSMSQVIGLSSSKISDQLKKRFSATFKQVLNSIRIKEAKRLLEETDLQVTDVAFKVGYNNYAHFFKIFRNETGFSPGKFRQEKK